jgi:hypothetical protein
MNRLACFAALVVAAGALGCSSISKSPIAKADPPAGRTVGTASTGVVPAGGFLTGLSTFDTGKDCKT